MVQKCSFTSTIVASAAIAAYTAALEEAGFVIVPKEPIDETLKAGGESEPFNAPGTGLNGLWHAGQRVASTVSGNVSHAFPSGRGVYIPREPEC